MPLTPFGKSINTSGSAGYYSHSLPVSLQVALTWAKARRPRASPADSGLDLAPLSIEARKSHIATPLARLNIVAAFAVFFAALALMIDELLSRLSTRHAS